jgi:uncharacterized membrane protein YkoI
MILNKTNYSAAILGTLLAFGATTAMHAAPASRATVPEEPTSGSIRVGDDEPESRLVKLAKVSRADAEAAATRQVPGKVIEMELDEENQFLVWNVEVLAKDGTIMELAIDAGNGEVLAMERDD